jgi:hypothetical protein
MKRFVLLFVLGLMSVAGFSQQYMYVNKDTLMMHKYPDYKSQAVLMLHAPCKVATEEVGDTSAEGRELARDWAAVRFFLSDGSWSGGTTYYGYVPKKYLVNRLSDITVEGADTTILLVVTVPSDSGNVQRAEINFKETSSGECYYINSHAKREYVGKVYCKMDDMEEQRQEEKQQER